MYTKGIEDFFRGTRIVTGYLLTGAIVVVVGFFLLSGALFAYIWGIRVGLFTWAIGLTILAVAIAIWKIFKYIGSKSE